MNAPHQTKVLSHFFKQFPVSVRLFKWLAFRAFVQQGQAEQLEFEQTQPTTQAVLTRWQALDTQSGLQPNSLFLVRLLLWFTAAFGGAGAMVGVLSLAAHQAVNIWLPLAIFAAAPLLFSLASAYAALVSPSRFYLQGHKTFAYWTQKLFPVQAMHHPKLVLAWFFWQAQLLALVFLIFALVAFAVLGTFQSFSFGWSSTFIQDSATFERIMAIICWPWHVVLASPSAALIESTQLGQAGIAMSGDEHWWPTLVAAMLCYGVLPRLLLSLFLFVRFKQQLNDDIAESSDLQQLLNRLHQQASLNPLEVAEALIEPSVEPLVGEQHAFIAWQLARPDQQYQRVLGQASWQADEQWLQQFKAARGHAVVEVRYQQTPTGELADCLALLARHNQVSLLLTGDIPSPERAELLLRGWQYFATQQQIPLHLAGETHA